MLEAVIYPPTITTNKQKLFACYSLVQQMIDEYNRQSAIATSDSKKYADKFHAYAKEQFKPKLKQLLAERNALMEKIRWDNYTPEEWKKIRTEEEKDAICFELFGDKSAESVKATLATSPLLDEVKTISLDSLTPLLGSDPTEDFTTYTEQDVGADRLTVTASKVAWTNADKDEFLWVVKDKGAAHFNDDFEHRLKSLYSATSNNGDIIFHWGLANEVNNFVQIYAADHDFLGMFWYNPADSVRFNMRECIAGTIYDDYYIGVSSSTVYYHTIERDEAVGTYGHLYDYICTTNYYGESGSELVDTLDLTLHEKEDFQYIYGCVSWAGASGGVAFSGYTEELDLQEGGAHYDRSGTALLGLLGSGSRGLGLERSDTGLLGLLATGSRGLGLARADTALLGLLSTGSRALSLSRSNTTLLGLKGIGSRVLAFTRLNTALLGLKSTATKGVNRVRTNTALLGLKTTATRSVAYTRTKTALLGLKTTGSRTIALTRAKTALLGLKATGIMSTAKHYIRTGIAYLGLVATGTRSIALARGGTALLGLKASGSRAISIIRSGVALLGLKAIGLFETTVLKIISARPYTIEIRNGAEDLIAILENARGIDYRQEINAPQSLRFEVPATDSKVDNILLANEYWLRDTRTGVVIRKFRLQRKRDTR